ncbi:MAG: MotA/TolQ/ExbB proton channel family protein [Oligoflexia bacterium]|nr:MotA/TolQ/ExbB proton channel family protein [Oligoflexia bacterium]
MIFEILLQHGGIGAYLILSSAVILAILGTERIHSLYFRLSYNTDAALETIRERILSRKYTDAIQVCNSKEKAPDFSVVKSALLAAENGREAMRSALGASVLEVTHRCDVGLQYLALIANVATLLGLFGTITGLIKTFSAIANADAAEKAKLLGLGISEAMYSTAAGLIVGMTAMVIHTVCTAKSDQIIGRAQDVGYKVITWIEQSERK